MQLAAIKQKRKIVAAITVEGLDNILAQHESLDGIKKLNA